MSVMANEADLATRFGITTIPISPNAIAARADKIVEEKDPRYEEYLADIKSRMDTSAMMEQQVARAAAVKLSLIHIFQEGVRNQFRVPEMERGRREGDPVGDRSEPSDRGRVR